MHPDLLPQPTKHSRPFWENCKRQVLSAPRCRSCGTIFFPPKPACIECLSPDLDFEASKGVGTVYSFTVIHRPAIAELETPYVVAIVELDEGWHVGANILECAPEDVRIGLRVEVLFKALSDEITMPCFVPASA